MSDESYPTHTEMFDVVMLKKGISQLTAKPEDFKRVKVTAPDPLSAQMHDDVLKESGYLALFAAKPDVLTDPEIQASRREIEGVAVDRSSI